MVNLHNQFQKLITQVDGLNDGIETRKLCLLLCLYVLYSQSIWDQFVSALCSSVMLCFLALINYVLGPYSPCYAMPS